MGRRTHLPGEPRKDQLGRTAQGARLGTPKPPFYAPVKVGLVHPLPNPTVGGVGTGGRVSLILIKYSHRVGHCFGVFFCVFHIDGYWSVAVSLTNILRITKKKFSITLIYSAHLHTRIYMIEINEQAASAIRTSIARMELTFYIFSLLS